ncbi:MAG: JAB domain-containing protein, partial [Phormidesmis sp.]
LAYKEKEHAAVVVMNVQHQWLATEVISIGTKNGCLFHPDEAFEAALKHDGKRIIIAHNHPSGELSPSPEDIQLTKQMVRGGYLLNVPVLDHLIIGNGDFKSIRQATSIWEEIEQERKNR